MTPEQVTCIIRNFVYPVIDIEANLAVHPKGEGQVEKDVGAIQEDSRLVFCCDSEPMG